LANSNSSAIVLSRRPTVKGLVGSAMHHYPSRGHL
jgi:hypothetical protein